MFNAPLPTPSSPPTSSGSTGSGGSSPVPNASSNVPSGASPVPPVPPAPTMPQTGAPTTTPITLKPSGTTMASTAVSSGTSVGISTSASGSAPPTPPPPGVPRPTPSFPGTTLSSSPPPSNGLPKSSAPLGIPTTPGASPIPPSGGQPPAGSPPSSGAKASGIKKPQMATTKKNFLRFLPFVVVGIAVLGIVGFVLSRVFGGGTTTPTTPSGPDAGQNQGARQTVPSQQVSLTYWGLWEPSEVLQQTITQFEQNNPGVIVQYTQHSPKDYRERLQTAIASGSGPDIFRFHASWTPMLRNELAPLPTNIYSAAEYNSIFYPVAAKQLQLNGQMVGVPLMYDGLALYYNKEMLQAADAQPPTTWAELRTLATKLTIREGDTIKRAGLAVGNANNVEHFSDIIGLLMLQNGADPMNTTSPEARDALLFYTNFVKNDKVWGDELPSSTIAFARGDVAMMFAPSWRVHEIKTQNPSLNFGIAPVPKLGEDKVAWATYWAEGVNTQSKNKEAAWNLIKYLSSAEVQQKLYSDQSAVRSFGEIYSRKDLANQLAGQEMVAPYLSDAPEADGWYLSSFTHDNGINDQIIKYYLDAVNAVLAGKSVEEVLLTVDQGTKQVLRQYGITTPGAAPNPATGG